LIYPSVHRDPQSSDEGTLHVSFTPDSGIDEFVIPLRPSRERVNEWVLIEDVALWGFTIDAYVCQAVQPTVSGSSPSELLSKYLGREVLLVFKGPAPRIAKPTPSAPTLDAAFLFQDGYPLMVLSNETIDDVAQRVMQAARKEEGWSVAGLDESKWGPGGVKEEEWNLVERFRPNIVFKGAKAAFDEDSWEEVVVEDAQNGNEKGKILLVSRCTRCLLPNVDPQSGIADKAVPFKVISKYRRIDERDRYSPCVGVNAVSQSSDFEIRVGDTVSVVKRLQRGVLTASTKGP